MSQDTQENKEGRKIEVSADALRELLEAVTGPSHHIRELQATTSLDKMGLSIGRPNPINVLVNEFNAWVEKVNTEAEAAADRQARDLTRAQEVESEMKKGD